MMSLRTIRIVEMQPPPQPQAFKTNCSACDRVIFTYCKVCGEAMEAGTLMACEDDDAASKSEPLTLRGRHDIRIKTRRIHKSHRRHAHPLCAGRAKPEWAAAP